MISRINGLSEHIESGLLFIVQMFSIYNEITCYIKQVVSMTVLC